MNQENPLVHDPEEKKTSADVITALYGDLTFKTTDDKSFKVKRVTLRTLPSVLSYVQMVADDLKIQGGMPTIDLLNPSTILQLISNRMEDTYAMVTLLSDATKDDLLDMEMDDSIGLIVKLVKVNKDFFVQKIMPLVKTLK